MQELDSVKAKTAEMAELALTMWQLTHRAFMEHNLDLFPWILNKENRLNELEKEVTEELIKLGKNSLSEEDKTRAIAYANISGDFELIGDYCKDILERVQIKIEEKLMFSEEAVDEYLVLYKRTEDALSELDFALKKDNPALVKEILKKEEHIDALVDEYRRRHDERLLQGKCSPFACNMFLNILDFTAAVYYHAKKVARSFIKIR
jgi:phosphate:Na+ symporter